jgi:hypothetical protein
MDIPDATDSSYLLIKSRNRSNLIELRELPGGTASKAKFVSLIHLQTQLSAQGCQSRSKPLIPAFAGFVIP